MGRMSPVDGKPLRGDIQCRGFLLNQLNSVLADGNRVLTYRWWELKNLIRYSGKFSLKDLARFFYTWAIQVQQGQGPRSRPLL